ncbi:hypothetical protein [Clostridium akagii]|uniref:hypothetical protein n=1 Tax=Clostridium akagii TaxID=91623 RepID=UPI0012EBCE30|nr:hypothetical protein [Clostridium akagii]
MFLSIRSLALALALASVPLFFGTPITLDDYNLSHIHVYNGYGINGTGFNLKTSDVVPGITAG